MLKLLEIGGPVMWVLAILSIYSLGVVLERLFYFRTSSGDVRNLLIGMSALVRKGAYAEAQNEASRVAGPCARVVEAVLSRHYLNRHDLRAVAQEAGQLEVPGLEKNLRSLQSIATMAPLLGMLGTFIGLLDYFMAAGTSAGGVEQEALAATIFEALISSAAGLTVAIPTYLFYMFLSSMAGRAIRKIERAGIEIVNIVCDARGGVDAVCGNGDDSDGGRPLKGSRED